MFPNPQDAIPLPPRPDLEQYKKLAKDLVKACASGDPAAIGEWAERWLESLLRARGEPLTERVQRAMDPSRSPARAFANELASVRPTSATKTRARPRSRSAFATRARTRLASRMELCSSAAA